MDLPFVNVSLYKQVHSKVPALFADPVVGTDQQHLLTFLWEAAEIGR